MVDSRLCRCGSTSPPSFESDPRGLPLPPRATRSEVHTCYARGSDGGLAATRRITHHHCQTVDSIPRGFGYAGTGGSRREADRPRESGPGLGDSGSETRARSLRKGRRGQGVFARDDAGKEWLCRCGRGSTRITGRHWQTGLMKAQRRLRRREAAPVLILNGNAEPKHRVDPIRNIGSIRSVLSKTGTPSRNAARIGSTRESRCKQVERNRQRIEGGRTAGGRAGSFNPEEQRFSRCRSYGPSLREERLRSEICLLGH
jgi:CDGSH-type Zn-finger protein